MMPPAAILAGGLATRLRPVTGTVPKAMVEVAGKPFIHHQLDLLKRKGIRRAVICAGHLGEQIRAYVKNGGSLGLTVDYSFDGATLLGTGGALRKAAPLLGDVFWVTYGDTYLDTDYAAILEFFRDRSSPGLMTVYRNHNRWDQSNILFAGGKIINYDKKRPAPDMRHIDYGLSLLSREILDQIPAGKTFDLADLYADLVKGGQMLGYEVDRRFYEIGSPAGLRETRAYLESLAPTTN